MNVQEWFSSHEGSVAESVLAAFSEDTFTSGHVYLWEDESGDVVDAVVFCSDGCHREYLRMRGIRYGGWNGCYEMTAPQWCSNCGGEF